MNYGLYQSAAGVMANSYRQDVIANNLANVETAGYKRDTASFEQRLTEAQLMRMPGKSNPLLENLGGGLRPHVTGTDFTQGDLESTGTNLDVAIFGKGYFAVKEGDDTKLTRDGHLSIDHDGYLVQSSGLGQQKVLDTKLQPIQIDGRYKGSVSIGEKGEITQNGQTVGQLGVFDVDDSVHLKKTGGNLLSNFETSQLKPATGSVRNEFLERSNVDPATELTQLMDAQRQLEANANMIRYQDQTLGRLVNDVGKMT